MESLWKILTGIATGAFLVFLCLWFIGGCNHKKEIARKDKIISDCLNAPVVRHDSIIHDTIKSIKWLKPKIVTVFIKDSTPAKFCEKYYSDTYKYVKGLLVGKIDYEIHSKDCEDQVRFTNVILPIDYRTETKTVTLHDTVTFYKAKTFHWGLYTDVTLNNFQTFSGFGLGGQLIFRDQVTIGLGATYIDKLYANVRIGILFKK